MQSYKSSVHEDIEESLNGFPSDGHPQHSQQRHPQAFDKIMPVTSLLLNSQPLYRSVYNTRDGCFCDHRFFPIDFRANGTLQQTTTQQLSSNPPTSPKTFNIGSVDDINTTECESDILISGTDNNAGDDKSANDADNDNDDDGNGNGNKNATFTPCPTRFNNTHIKSSKSSSSVSDDTRLRLNLAEKDSTNSKVSTSNAPPPIDIQRKKFLMELPTPNDDSHNDSNFVDEIKINDEKSLAICDDREDDDDDVNNVLVVVRNVIVDPHNLAFLKDFREDFGITEALVKTSAMTSTSQIKQRLAARKLEIELASVSNSERRNASSIATSTDNFVAPERPNSTECETASSIGTNAHTTVANIDSKLPSVTQACILVKSENDGNDFEPPRDLLLYLVRMGSFNSAPKINNVDSQDDELEIPKGLNTSELLHYVKLLRGEQYPQLLSRCFFKSIPSLTTQLSSNDITDGLRYLQLNTVSRVCSAPLSASPNNIRLLQWNVLSQTLGQNNDGFVRCPVEALTWENRKFLIVQEILQHNPDIVCLQEVDHFKFLKTILGSQNYEGIFFPKPDSPCLYIEKNNGPDGCAIFFKRDKFELKKFETRVLEVWRVQSNQVAITAIFNVRAINKEIAVCTTHLKARQGSLLSKLRNEQGRDLIRFVRNFAGENRPVLLCGDFNAEPIEPVYATILTHEKMKFSSAYADMKLKEVENNSKFTQDAGDIIDKDIWSDEDYLQKSIKNEPPYTTWKIREDGEECHTIDYVFYSRDHFKVLNCLEFPHGDEIGENRTPSFQYPSDHFSLVSDFEILLNSQPNEHDSKLKAQ